MNSFEKVDVQELWEVLLEVLEAEEDFDGYHIIRAIIILDRDDVVQSRVQMFYREDYNGPHEPYDCGTKRARYNLSPERTIKMHRGFTNVLGISDDLYRMKVSLNQYAITKLTMEGSNEQMLALS